jgi:DNA-directed RNA polymerase subunit N (RpoN/RPB10)
MIIPIRCFTCGKVLANKYDYYVEEVDKLKQSQPSGSNTPIKHFENIQTKEILDKLELTRYCCRRHMIATVDLMDTI